VESLEVAALKKASHRHRGEEQKKAYDGGAFFAASFSVLS
jgi:hypothetical protein